MQKQQGKPTINELKSLCDKVVSPRFANFIKGQVDLLSRQAKGRRYSVEIKKMSLCLHFLSPKCYKHLQKLFCLPSSRVLQRFVEQIKFSAGYNETLLAFLKLKVASMDQQDKVCTLCVDEISLKCDLYYNYGHDEVVGLEDDGFSKTSTPANSAAVIMIRGIKRRWKQPVGYIFTSTSCNAIQLQDVLGRYVQELSNIGLALFT